MKPSEGRRESRSYQLLIYVVLIVGGLPILLPLYWLVLASLKTNDGINAAPPHWTPIDARDFVTIDGQELRVSVFDDGRASQTGVARVKLLRQTDTPLVIPPDRIARETIIDHFVEIDGVRRRVEPRGQPDRDGIVELALTGTMRTEEVASDRILVSQEPRYLWSVLGISFEVLLDGAEAATIHWSSPPPTIRVHPDAIAVGDNAPQVRWNQRLIPVEIISRNAAGGYQTVRLISPPNGLSVPAVEIRREDRIVRRLTSADPAGETREIRVLRQDLQRGVSTVEFLNEPRTHRAAAAAVTRTERHIFFATLLGQRVEVQPRSPTDERTGPVAIDVPGPIAVAAGRVRHEAPLRPQWSNYVAAWREQDFDLYIVNTLFIAVLVVLGTVLSCGLVGYAFARLEFPGRDLLFLILLSTMMIPAQVTSIPMFVMFAKIGWLDSYKPLIIPHFLAQSAFFVFLYRQFMLTIPVDLEDSARIDGCGPFQTWWLIMMPLSRPIVVTVAVFSFIGVWNDFLYPLLYINSDEKQTVALGLHSFKTAYGAAAPQLIMAASVMMIVPSIILFFAAQKAFMRGVVVSGVKG